jgi:hypothetical protein
MEIKKTLNVKIRENHQGLRQKLTRKIIVAVIPLLIMLYLTERDMYGYEILLRIRNDFQVCFTFDSVYRNLKFLEKERLLEGEYHLNSARLQADSNRWTNNWTKEPVKFYHLTTNGRVVLLSLDLTLTKILNISRVKLT